MASMAATHNQVAYLQYLQYASVTHNGGGHFNGSSGTFTCPVTGVYLFSIQLMDADVDKDISIALIKGSTKVLTVSTADSKQAIAGNKTGHGLTVQECLQNEQLRVKLVYTTGGFAVFGYVNTVFAGGLLYGSIDEKNQVNFFQFNLDFVRHNHSDANSILIQF